MKRAIEEFHITQNPHMLSLYRTDGSMVSEQGTVGEAHLKPGELLLLRQNAVKGGAVQLRLAHGQLEETFATLRRCGMRARECVVYWTGPADLDLADGIEHPDHRATSHGYEINDGWLTTFSRDLALSHRSVKAQRVRYKWHRRFGYMPRIEIPTSKRADLRYRVKQLTARNTTQWSLPQLLQRLNPLLRGWGNYYRFCTGASRQFSAARFLCRRLHLALANEEA